MYKSICKDTVSITQRNKIDPIGAKVKRKNEFLKMPRKSRKRRESLRVRVLKRNLSVKLQEAYPEQYQEYLRKQGMKDENKTYESPIDAGRRKLGRSNLLEDEPELLSEATEASTFTATSIERFIIFSYRTLLAILVRNFGSYI